MVLKTFRWLPSTHPEELIHHFLCMTSETFNAYPGQSGTCM